MLTRDPPSLAGMAAAHGANSVLVRAIREHPSFSAATPSASSANAASDAAPDAGASQTRPSPPTLTPNFLNQRVRLHGLNGRPELNGQLGVAFTFCDESGRYGVKLDDSKEKVLLRPSNLAGVGGVAVETTGGGGSSGEVGVAREEIPATFTKAEVSAATVRPCPCCCPCCCGGGCCCSCCCGC